MLLAVLATCQLIIAVDSSVTVAALPVLRNQLHLSVASLSWVQDAYTLPFGGLLLFGARAGDKWGRKRVLLLSIGVFTVASLAAGISPNSAVLLPSRALQGSAAAFIAPSALSLIVGGFREGEERHRAIRIYTAVGGIGGVIGLVLGGLLTQLISWRAAMFVNIPIGIAVVSLGRRALVETPRIRGRLDAVGVVVSTAGVGTLVFALVHAAEGGLADPATYIPFATGVLLLGAFIAIEGRVVDPITPLRLFASRVRLGANAIRFLLVAGNYGTFFILTQYFQQVLHYSPLAAGAAFAPTAGMSYLSMYVVRWLLPKIGASRLIAMGLVCASLSAAWLSTLTPQSSYVHALPALIAFGVGGGASYAPLTAAAVSGLEPKDFSAAAGLINASHQLGATFGVAFVASLFASVTGVRNEALLSPAHFTSGARLALLSSSVMFFVALCVVLAIRLYGRAIEGRNLVVSGDATGMSYPIAEESSASAEGGSFAAPEAAGSA